MALKRSHHLAELSWLAPFLCIGLVAGASVRPAPSFPPPQRARNVTDAGGTQITIELPFRGIVTANPIGPYLGNTQSPDTIAAAGGAFNRVWYAQTLLGRIYPQVLARDALWSDSMFNNLETMLAFNPGAYFAGMVGPHGMFSTFRQIGLPVLYTSTEADKTWDETSYHEARIQTALTGEPELGERLIADNKRAYADLDRELQPATLGPQIRVLRMFSNRARHKFGAGHVNPKLEIYNERVNAANASTGWSASNWDDTERLLAMDPDVILLNGRNSGLPGYPKWAVADGPEDVMHDPRWAGLKAVQTGRVYRQPGWAPGLPEDLHLQPLWTRWLAEVLYPEKLKPRLRELMRDHFLQWFGYRLSDEEIDAQLHLDENGLRPGYARFSRDLAGTGAPQ